MMLKILLSTLLLSTSLFAAENVAESVSQATSYNYAGVSVGAAKPAGSNLDGIPVRLAYGLEFNHAYSTMITMGAFVSRNNGELFDSNVDMAITTVGIQVLYSPVQDSFLSLKTGVGFISYSTDVGGVKVTAHSDSNPIFVAPGAGIVFPINEKIQFAPSLNYAFFLKNDKMVSFQVFDVMGTLRYQF